MRASGFSSLSSLTLLALFAAARLSAQEAAAQEAGAQEAGANQSFVESIDVRVVNLEVFVTDRQGQRVGGLTREDFEVLEDGRPIQVSNFYAVTGGRTEIPDAGSVMLLGGETGEDTSEALPLEQRLNLAIVIDDLSLDARNRNRLLLAIGNAVLPRLRPDDRVLVGLLGGSGVRIGSRSESARGGDRDRGGDADAGEGELPGGGPGEVPLSRLVLVPGESVHEGRVTLFLGAQDSQGRLSPIQEIRVPIQVPVGDSGALAQTAAYKATLELRPEAHRIAVSIRDELGNTDSAVVTDYTPGVKK